MIRSKAEYMYYLQADKEALKIGNKHPLLSPNSMLWLTDPIYRWERLLRKCEYWENCKPEQIWTIYRLWIRWRFARKSLSLGLSIPINTCGPGLCILHYGSIVISRHARIGANCTINSCVNIGAHKGGAPIIGDSVYIGPGAKLFGLIEISDEIKIGANAVVCTSCTEVGGTYVGVPASIVKREKEID